MIRNEYSKQFTFHSEKFKGVIPKLLPSYFSLFVWRYWWCEPKQMCFCCMAEPQASVASLSSGLLMGRGVVLREYLWMDVKKIKQEKTKTVFNVDLKAFPLQVSSIFLTFSVPPFRLLSDVKKTKKIFILNMLSMRCLSYICYLPGRYTGAITWLSHHIYYRAYLFTIQSWQKHLYLGLQRVLLTLIITKGHIMAPLAWPDTYTPLWENCSLKVTSAAFIVTLWIL